jgi:hypothetical protein
MPRAAPGQEFGGSPPWGLERPVPFSGITRPGVTFEYPIGNGLAVKLVPAGTAWEIDVGRPGDREDYAVCANPPFKGPWGVGQKRWIDFVLTPEDLKLECLGLERAMNGDRDWRPHATGRCWVRLLGAEPLKFDGECAPHGAWELWRLPATYVIPDGFTGWVTAYYRQKGKPKLPREENRYLLRVGELAAVYTSSDLREDDRGAKFVRADGRAISTEGPARMIWDWQAGDANACAPFQSFFVGTADRHISAGRNPALENPAWDCAKLLRIEWQ